MHTAQDILSLSPKDLMARDKKEGGRFLKRLIKRWHPDTNTDPLAARVLEHVMGVYKKELVREGFSVRFGDKTVWYHARYKGECDVGQRFVGARSFAWVFEAAPDLAQGAYRRLRSLPAADDKMRAQLAAFAPSDVRLGMLEDDTPVLVVDRKEEAVLADWIEHHGSLPIKHLAWLGSGLLNIAAWAEWAQLCVPSLGLETVSLNPSTHAVRLVGGWETVCAMDTRPTVLPNRVLRLFPAAAAANQTLPPQTMGELVRLTLREAVGDPSGLALEAYGVTPAVRAWMQSPPRASIVADYKAWYAALETDFGKRRFETWDKKVWEVPGYEPA